MLLLQQFHRGFSPRNYHNSAHYKNKSRIVFFPGLLKQQKTRKVISMIIKTGFSSPKKFEHQLLLYHNHLIPCAITQNQRTPRIVYENYAKRSRSYVSFDIFIVLFFYFLIIYKNVHQPCSLTVHKLRNFFCQKEMSVNEHLFSQAGTLDHFAEEV